MRKILFYILITLIVISMVACVKKQSVIGNPSEVNGVSIPVGIQGNKKIALINNLGHDEHAAQIISGAIIEGKSLGLIIDTFVTTDDAEFADRFEEVLLNGYDGIFFTHAQQNIVELVKKANKKGIPCVGFDSPLTPIELDNVAMTSQDDQDMARRSLQALVDSFPDRKPMVVKMLVNGFPAQENRDLVYREFVENGLIEEIANIAEVGDWTNVAGINANAIGGVLANYDVGEIDAIWAAWDSFSTGAHIALKENNRQEIKIFSVDVANVDLQNMQEENSSWVMTAAADAKAVGTINIRILATMMAGEQSVKEFELPISSIYQKDLIDNGGKITVETLGDVYDTWGKCENLQTEWMTALKTINR